MKAFTIKVSNAFGKFTICEWQAESASEAVKEFKALNPAYKNKGVITAE